MSSINRPDIGNNPLPRTLSNSLKLSNSNEKLEIDNTETVRQQTDNNARPEELKEDSPEYLEKITKELKSFLNTLDVNLQFELHEKTGKLIVKICDTVSGKVLREYPPREFLDTIDKIREKIGLLL